MKWCYYLLYDSGQQLILQPFKCDGEVDEGHLDTHRRQEVGVGHTRRHI